MSQARIRILLVDDHAVVREGLRALLEQQDDMEIVGEAENGQLAVQRVAQLEPDVVILDMKMPGGTAVDTIAAIKRARPAAQVLVFTSYAEDSQVRDALNAGATGYLLKDVQRGDLLRAVHEVAVGHAWLHPQAQRQMIDWMRRPASPLDALTSRERSVLQALGEGLSNKQIARRFNLTEGTVKGYVSQVFEKIGVTDRTQAALFAQKEGLHETAANTRKTVEAKD